MSINANPQAGSFVAISETASPGATTASTPSENVAQGNPATGTVFTVGTGTGTSMNVQWSGRLTLTGGGGGTTLDLTTLSGLLGTKTFTKVRGIRIFNRAAADSGFSVAIKPGASNPFAPFLTGTTPAWSVPANSSLYVENLNVAGWTVDSTHKGLLLDPGANTQIVDIVIFGE